MYFPSVVRAGSEYHYPSMFYWPEITICVRMFTYFLLLYTGFQMTCVDMIYIVTPSVCRF